MKENGKTNGWVINSAITDFGVLLKEEIYPENSYHDVETLQRLLNGDRRKKVFDTTSKKIFLPYLHSAHYTLFVINLEDREMIHIYYYNSLSSVPCPIQFEQIYDIFKMNIKPTGHYQIPTEFIGYEAKCPQQSNSKDCGIYTMLNMIHRSAGKGDGEIQYAYNRECRKYIAESLQKGSLIPKLLVDLNRKVVKIEENESDEITLDPEGVL